MRICPSYDYERKDIKDWTVFDYIDALTNAADHYEFNGELEKSRALNDFAYHTILHRFANDYNKRHEKEGIPFVRLTLIGDR